MIQSSAAVRRLFLDTAAVVHTAVADPTVARVWNEPSVLEEQTVGSVAGHLARGGVWVVAEYLDAPFVPEAPAVDSAAGYYAAVISATGTETDSDTNRQIRARGAEIAAAGPDAIAATLAERIAHLTARLRDEPGDRVVTVTWGTMNIGLDAYLETRLVEQVVHLDDLARSVGREPWRVSAAAEDLVLQIGLDIGRVRHGATAMLRGLYRTRLDPILPVL